MTPIPRTSGLTAACFADRYLAPERPVVITDAMRGWPATTRWDWSYFDRRFGDHEVDVYGDWFEPTGSERLHTVLAGIADDQTPDPERSYVRWSSRDRPGPGRWADDVFAVLADDWAHPAFLPTTDYAVPYVSSSDRADIPTQSFPYRSLLLSAVGARTRLHVDPWASSALLCQIVGRKRIVLHDASHNRELIEAAARNEPAPELRPAYDDELLPGEILYIPGEWWHEATTIEASISLTWNFVHALAAQRTAEHVSRYPADDELVVLEHFMSDAGLASPAEPPGDAAASILAALRGIR